MMRSLFAGVSGLKSHQTKMDVIGDNIANVNTAGFKGSRVMFQDMLNQTLSAAQGANDARGGTNPQQVGLGVGVGSIDVNFTDGTRQSTGVNTDLAISGAGFFVVTDGANKYYTRSGAFKFDEQGNFIVPGSGLQVQGWLADANGNITTSSDPTNIKIPKGDTMSATATTNTKYSKNLSADADLPVVEKKKETVNIPVNKVDTQITDDAISAGGVVFGNTKGYDYTDAAGVSYTVRYKLNAAGTAYDTKETTALTKGGAVTITPPASIAEVDNQVTRDLANLPVGASGASGIADAGDPTKNCGYKYTDANGILITVIYSESGGAGTGYNYKTTTGGSKTDTFTGTNVIDPAKLDNRISTENAAKGGFIYSDSTKKGYSVTTIKDDGTKIVKEVLYEKSSATAAPTDPYDAKTSTVTTTPAQPTFVSSFEAYDSEGIAHKVTGTFAKVKGKPNTWTFTPEAKTSTDLKIDPPVVFTVEFYDDGTFKKAVGYDPADVNQQNPISTISFKPTAGAQVNIKMDFSGLTQFAGKSEPTSEKDGNAAGSLKAVSLDTQGNIIGTFTNGLTKVMARVAMATFNNPEGLTKSGNNLYSESINSGQVQVSSSGSGGAGSVTPNSLEMSNVDLAEEFSNMIITQRGFQANSKIITVADEMLETLANLKR